eukprot:2035413-Pyramimonas_sp.AAC.1
MAKRTGIGLVQDPPTEAPASSSQVNREVQQAAVSLAAAALFAPDRQGFQRLKQHHSQNLTSSWMSVPGQTYSQDLSPEDMEEQERQQLEKYYVCMPEEFYYFSGLTVITPDNAEEWCQHAWRSASRELSGGAGAYVVRLTETYSTRSTRGCPAWQSSGHQDVHHGRHQQS